MDLNTFIADTDRRRALAERLKKNPSYLWQIATGRRRASTDLAQQIERETAELGPEQVPKESLRPDVWVTVDASIDTAARASA